MKTRRRKAADSSNSSPSLPNTSENRPETIDEEVNKDCMPTMTVETKEDNDDDDDDDDGSSSDSSIGDYLKSTDKIDLNSSFFKIEKEKPTNFRSIEKKILSNVDTLSDSEGSVIEPTETFDDDDNEPVRNAVDSGVSEPRAPNEVMRFEQLEEYTKKLEDVKHKLKSFNSNLSIPEEKLDIGQLLAAGETANEEISYDLSGSEDGDDSDSEMEEVEEKSAIYRTIPKEGVQITLNVPLSEKQKKKSTDIMMVIKRKINRVKKECQVYVHKVHLLCWVAHGNFLNSIVNDPVLLGMALSLIPSQHCYPKDRIDLGYLEQITKWYVKLIKVKDKELGEKPYETPLIQSLKLQINKKEAYLKRDLVLIFVCMMRSLGIRCRLVVSFRVLPLRPPSSELCSLATKTDKAEPGNNVGEPSKGPAKKDIGKKPATNLRKNQKSTEEKVTAQEPKSSCSNEKSKKTNTASVKNDGSKPAQKITKTAQKREKKSTAAGTKILQVDGPCDPLENSKNTDVDLCKFESEGNKKESSETVLEKEKNVRVKRNLRLKKIPQVDGANDLPKEKSIKAAKTNPKTQKTDSADPVTSVRNARADPKRKKSQEIGTKNDLPKEKQVQAAKTNSKSQKIDPAGDENIVRSRVPRNKKPVKYIEPASDDELVPDSAKRMKTKPNGKGVVVSPGETTSAFFKNVHESPTKETQKAIRKALKLPDLASAEAAPKTVPQIPEASSFFPRHRPSIRTAIKKMKNVSNTANDIVRLVKQRIEEQKQIDRSKTAKKKKGHGAEDDDDDSDYAPEPVVKKKRPSNCDNSDDDFDMRHKRKMKTAVRKSKENDRRILSTDEENDDRASKKTTKIGNDFWVEVYLEAEEKWIAVDVVKGKVHCVAELFSRATQPVTYIVAWNSDSTLKDVTSRYCKNWNTVTRKLRVDKDWWDATLKPYIGKKTARDREEDEDLARQQLDQPLPTTISEYKNHPLYALKRHLLKFEAIYPPDAVTLGFVRNEPVYARECVYTLHSRETWVKQARVVKPGEQPYKIVKARPKYDKLSGSVITDIPLEVFGPWQTQDYEPPVAENGMVPRNAYGNVELFKPCMLPKGTVHLQLPGLNKVARKLGIDCASAMVGFDYHSGGSHPAFDGFVVCEEFKETLIAAWQQEQEEAEKRALEKIENRVYGNWKKLIKGLLIRERLKAKYGFGGPSTSDGSSKKKKPKGPRFVTKKN